MRITHPRGISICIDVDGDHVTPDENGHYDIGDASGWLESFAAANDCDAEDLIVAATCDVVKSDGEVCGRELPCAYHSEES